MNRRISTITWFFLVATAAFAAEPMPEATENTTGFRTVDEAMTTLRMRPDVEITETEGWTIVADRTNHIIWSFAPKGHLAFPSVVKRTIVQNGDNLSVQMDVLCQASKDSCDALVREFQALNARMRESMQRNAAEKR